MSNIWEIFGYLPVSLLDQYENMNAPLKIIQGVFFIGLLKKIALKSVILIQWSPF